MVNIFHRCSLKSKILREFLAELTGVAFICAVDNGAIAQQAIFRNRNVLSENIAAGIAVAFGTYLSFNVSGGHVNPAVTVAFACVGKFPWRKVPAYLLAQHLGAFFSGFIVYYAYYDAQNDFDGGRRQIQGDNATAAIYATYPQKYLSTTNGFLDQVLGTALLLMFTLAVLDDKNAGKRIRGLEPLLIGIFISGIGMSYGANCGYAVHPARDFGPRLFTAVWGWGFGVFSAGNNFWWIPIVGSHVGAIIGAVVYTMLIGSHSEHDSPPSTRSMMNDVYARAQHEESVLLRRAHIMSAEVPNDVS